MVLITRVTRFSAAHRYYLSRLSPAENERRFGACALPHGHGHDYRVEATFAGAVDARTGMVVNISELKPLLEREIVLPLDGAYLTAEHPYLDGEVPATEVLVRCIYLHLAAAVRRDALPVTVHAVRLDESRRLWAECRAAGGGPMVTLTRSYEFAAAHRLHAGGLGEAENLSLFGKCNNPHGHGHNYVVEVTVGGRPDPVTGLLTDLPALDRVVHAEVVDRYDHRHLNLDLEEFRELNPTSENLVRVIWQRLHPSLPGLRRVTVRETERNIFTYEGEAE